VSIPSQVFSIAMESSMKTRNIKAIFLYKSAHPRYTAEYIAQNRYTEKLVRPLLGNVHKTKQ
jgi:hypothetical protein